MMKMSTRTRKPLALTALGWLAFASGTAWAGQDQPPAPRSAATAPEERPYRLQLGDELSVKLFYHPTLNQDVIVRPDGRISLQLLDEIPVAGLTPQELSLLLEERYSEKLESPEVSVIVKAFGGQRVFVAGEVGEPGVHPLTARTTALQAIAMAQGFRDTARLTQVLIIRRGPDFAPRVLKIDMTRVFDGSNLANDVALEPYDVVFVPRSTIANVNKFVREFIKNNLPFDFGIRFDLVP